MRFVRKATIFCGHISSILSITFLVFHILDWYNPLMAFSSNMISARLIFILCIFSLLNSLGSRYLLVFCEKENQ